MVLLGRETIYRDGKRVGWLSSGGYGYTVGCAFHGLERGEPGRRPVSGTDGQQAAIVGVRQLVVGRQIGEIEQGRVGAGVIPIDEPEPMSVIEEIGGEKIAVAKDDLDRPDDPFEAVQAHARRS